MKAIVHDRDNLDDRATIHRQLDLLPPEQRIAWLEWVCANAVFPKSDKRPVVAASTGLATEVFFDWWTIAAEYEVDVPKCLEHLGRLVAGRSVPFRRARRPRPLQAKRPLPHDFLSCPKLRSPLTLA